MLLLQAMVQTSLAEAQEARINEAAKSILYGINTNGPATTTRALNGELYDILNENTAFSRMTEPNPGVLGQSVINELHSRGVLFAALRYANAGGEIDSLEPENMDDPQLASTIVSLFGQTLQSPNGSYSYSTEIGHVSASYCDGHFDARFYGDDGSEGIIYSGELRDTDAFELAASQAVSNPLAILDGYEVLMVANRQAQYMATPYNYEEQMAADQAQADVAALGFSRPQLHNDVNEATEEQVARVESFLQYQADTLARECSVPSLSVAEYIAELSARINGLDGRCGASQEPGIFEEGSQDMLKAFNRGRVFGLVEWLEIALGREDLIGAHYNP
jgi:hypothetical protein